MSAKATRMTKDKPKPLTAGEMLALSRQGISYAEIARRDPRGLSRERVRQLVMREDPEHQLPRPEKPKPAEPDPCPVDGKKVKAPRAVYCSDRCAEAARIFRDITHYYEGHRKALARYALKNQDKAQRNYAKKVRLGKTRGRRWIIEGSKRYEKLKKAGLLEKLPPEIVVKYKADREKVAG